MNGFKVTYLDGPKVLIPELSEREYSIKFIDNNTEKCIYSTKIKGGSWTKVSRKWFTKWRIEIDGIIADIFNLNNKNVRINIDSKALGDTIAWLPYVVKFSEIHKCKVYVSSCYNYLFENLSEYNNISFIDYKDLVDNLYIKYNIGWYMKDNKWEAFDKYPNPVNQIPLQKTATDILGLDYEELNYGISIKEEKIKNDNKYIVFAPQASSGCKQWPHKNWQVLADHFVNKGYDIVILSKDRYHINNAINIWGKELNNIFNYLQDAEYFIGLGSGLSWANWALGKYTYMINGFSIKDHEFSKRITKIENNKCIKCWNDPVHIFNRNDWNWCPVYKGTKMQFVCQTSITPEQVINTIDLNG